ncbi:uncharacterized protein LOC112164591 isoform X3 [Rosa chinensis]|uniref:uncharacterized protein LOC112164591 isoform X3 n=1 Tax=Rosa chinensis TaxID=74649 RepID=UPI001AD94CC8|nr:uncharacterized protein LOC112164591 isoform X3 [Rosa chinensis]
MKTQRPGLEGGRRRHGGRKLYRFSISSNNGLGLSTSLEISVSPRRLSLKSQSLLDGSGPLLRSSTIEGLFNPHLVKNLGTIARFGTKKFMEAAALLVFSDLVKNLGTIARFGTKKFMEALAAWLLDLILA